MVNICDIPTELLPFKVGGLCLQEPIALLSNLLISITAFIIYFKYNSMHLTLKSDFHKYWKLFYLFIGCSTFLGGFGHVFYQYTGNYGKFPSWILAFIAAFYAAKAMISIPLLSKKIQQFALGFITLKFFVLLGLALYTEKFLFVTIDTAITYLLFCMGLGIYYWVKGIAAFKYTVFAVVVVTPSVFIFSLNLNPSIWFNKNDLSHVLIAITIAIFYIGIVRFNQFRFKLTQ